MARRHRAPRQRAATAAASLLGVALVASGCSGGGTGSSSSTSADPSSYATDGTFTYALGSDPGNLDPLQAVASVAIAFNQFTYDRLVRFDEKGEAQSNLAAEWTADTTTASFTLAEGVTCADGTPLTASDVTASLDYVSDPANASPLLSLGVPAGIITTADDDAGTVEVTSPAPNAFLLQNLAFVPIVCKAGMADRSTLQQSSDGTGPYTITEAVPDDHYTLTRREGYTWGQDGGTTAEEGLPETVVVRIVPNESTAANLVVTEKINAAIIAGPDGARLEKTKGVSAQTTPTVTGEVWFNHRDGHGTADADVRRALVMALDRAEIATVATGGNGEPMKAQAIVEPAGCQYDAAAPSVPEKDVAGAKELLAASGVDTSAPLTMLSTTGNTDVAAAVELMIEQWESELGVTVTSTAVADTAFTSALFGSDSWDIAWAPLNVYNPAQATGFFSGGSPLDTEAPGSNFSSIANEDYAALAATAGTTPGKEGCDTWDQAEQALYSAADLYPVSQTPVPFFVQGAEVTTVGGTIDPTSIRVLEG